MSSESASLKGDGSWVLLPHILQTLADTSIVHTGMAMTPPQVVTVPLEVVSSRSTSAMGLARTEVQYSVGCSARGSRQPLSTRRHIRKDEE